MSNVFTFSSFVWHLGEIYFLYPEMLEKEQEEEEGGTLARKVGEAVTNTFGVVVTAIDIPLGECCPKQHLNRSVR